MSCCFIKLGQIVPFVSQLHSLLFVNISAKTPKSGGVSFYILITNEFTSVARKLLSYTK